MTRLRGRALRGARLHASSPVGLWLSTTMLGAIRRDGFTTCMANAGVPAAAAPASFSRRCNLPTLHPGDAVLMDNLVQHKKRRRWLWCSLPGQGSLPSPPIHPVSILLTRCGAKSKTPSALRKSFPGRPCHAIATAYARVTPENARSWFTSWDYNYI